MTPTLLIIQQCCSEGILTGVQLSFCVSSKGEGGEGGAKGEVSSE